MIKHGELSRAFSSIGIRFSLAVFIATLPIEAVSQSSTSVVSGESLVESVAQSLRSVGIELGESRAEVVSLYQVDGDAVSMQSYSSSPESFSTLLDGIDLENSVIASESLVGFQLVSLDASLFASIKPFSIPTSGSLYRLGNRSYRPVIRRQSRHSELVYLTMVDDESRDLALLTVDAERDTVSGWFDQMGVRREIVPALTIDRTPVKGRGILIDRAPLPHPSENLDDHGDGITNEPVNDLVSTESGGPDAGCDADDAANAAAPSRLELSRNLEIYVEFTARAYAESNRGAVVESSQSQHWGDVRTSIERQAGPIEKILENSQIFVHVPTPLTFESKYVEPSDGSTVSLRELAMQLAASDEDAFVSVRQQRAKYKADIAILVVHIDDNMKCGYVPSVPASVDEAYAVVNWKCIDSTRQSLIHEIGHLLGGNHESVDKESRSPKYARAFRNGQVKYPFVTMMGIPTNCGGRNCTRKNQFSSHYARYYGAAMGNYCTANNERAIRENIESLVNFGEAFAGQGGESDSQRGNGAGDVWVETSAINDRIADSIELNTRLAKLNSVEQDYSNKNCAQSNTDSCLFTHIALLFAAEDVLEAKLFVEGAGSGRRLYPEKNMKGFYFPSSYFRGGEGSGFRKQHGDNFDRYLEYLAVEVSSEISAIPPERRILLRDVHLILRAGGPAVFNAVERGRLNEDR